MRPYADRVYHPRTWRGWFDFGSGLMGDVAVHTADAAIYAMSLPQPYRAEVEGEDFSPEYIPKNAIVRLYFKPTNQSKEVVLHWYEDPDDVPRPAALEEGRKLARDGLYMVGEEASVMGNGMRPRPVIIPDAKRREIGRIPQTLPRFGSHHKTWIESCFDRSKPAVSEFTEAASLMETILVGSLAQRAGHDIEWDSANRRVPGHPEMDKWIRPEYHNGYATPRYS